MNRWVDEEMRNPAICNDGEALGGRYAKWNKPDRKTNIAWSYMWNLKQNKTNLHGNREEKDGWLGAKRRYGSKDTNLQL